MLLLKELQKDVSFGEFSMKNLIVLFTLAASTFVSASTLVKTFDGGVAVCKEGADVGSRGYSLKLLNEINTNTHRNLNFEVSLLSCANTNDGLRFVPISLDSIVDRPNYNFTTDQLESLQIQLSNTRFIAFTENGDILGNVLLKENEAGKIQVSLSIAHINNAKQVILNLTATQTITSKDGQLLDRGPVIAKTFLLNLN